MTLLLDSRALRYDTSAREADHGTEDQKEVDKLS